MTAEQDEQAKRIVAVLAGGEAGEARSLDVHSSLNVLGSVVAYVLGAVEDESARSYLDHIYGQSRVRRAALPADDQPH